MEPKHIPMGDGVSEASLLAEVLLSLMRRRVVTIETPVDKPPSLTAPGAPEAGICFTLFFRLQAGERGGDHARRACRDTELRHEGVLVPSHRKLVPPVFIVSASRLIASLQELAHGASLAFFTVHSVPNTRLEELFPLDMSRSVQLLQ